MDRLQRVSSNRARPLIRRDPVAGDPMLTGPLDAFAPEANVRPPVLAAVARYGNRIDEVVFHPSWHWLLERGVTR